MRASCVGGAPLQWHRPQELFTAIIYDGENCGLEMFAVEAVNCHCHGEIETEKDASMPVSPSSKALAISNNIRTRLGIMNMTWEFVCIQLRELDFCCLTCQSCRS